MQLNVWVLVGVLAIASAAQASVLQVIPGQPLPARSHGAMRRRALNEVSVAKIHGEQKECDQPNVPQVEQLKKQLPKLRTPATIVKGDENANRIWGEIQKSGLVPNIQPRKGEQDHMGIASQATDSYNSKQDPDCWWSAGKCTKPKHNNIPTDLTTCSEPDTWGLSFDDGPNCTHNEFYDFLQKNKLRASLMYIGSNVVDWPYQAQRGLADGHDICVHTWSHKYMTTLSNEQVFAELYYTIKAIKSIVGVTPRCWRPPFGDVDDRVRGIAAGLGLRTIVWEADTDDWNVQPVGSLPSSKIDQNYQSIIGMGKQSKSPMVLTHEINALTMGEFQKQFPKIKQGFKNVVPLTACVGATHPYPEDITYPNFKEFTSGNLKAQGIPSGDKMQIDPSPKFTPTPLSKQGQYSYYKPSQKGGSKAKGGSNAKGSSNAQGGNNAQGGSSSNGGSNADGGSGPKGGARAAQSDASSNAQVQLWLGAVSVITTASLLFMTL